MVEALAASYGDHLALEPLYDDVAALGRAAVARLVALGVLRDRPDLLTPAPARWSRRASEWAISLVPERQICSRELPIT